MTGVGRAAAITAGAALATMAVDRASKLVVERSLAEGEPARGPFGIRIRRITNDRPLAGVGGGALLAAGAALAVGAAVTGTALRRPLLLPLGGGILAGAMGANLIDRATRGGVTDFLVSPLGVVNAADLALGAGIVLAGMGLAVRR